MGYQALLFCPDDKTARTVTQVLSELEFTVEACVETFAAVKKLMGAHFDAVVVDCDNEQNAALLFKSARNSSSNQTSLAVAVVEGQAGVAKAFRIGANLVLTKPINIEQAKGTLRVARGLLRKGDPAKPGTGALAAGPPAPVQSAPPAAPVKPVAAKPIPDKSAPPKPAAAIPVKSPLPPKPSPAWPTHAAVASTTPAVNNAASEAAADDDPLEINVEDDVPAPAAAPAPRIPTPVSQATKLPTSIPATGMQSKAAARPAAPRISPTISSGAASAPAPAREVNKSTDLKTAEKPVTGTDHASAAQTGADLAERSHADPAPTTFTFGGNATSSEASSGSKKILLAVAAIVVVAAAAYGGWSYYQSSSHYAAPAPSFSSVPVSRPSVPAPTPQTSSATPANAPATTESTTTNNPAAASTVAQNSAPKESASNSADDAASNPDADIPPPAPLKKSPAAHATKPAAKAVAPAPSEDDSAPAPEAAPLVVKGGKVPASKSKTEAPADAQAPSMAGIATPGTGAPPPNLLSSAGNAPTPVLQSIHISQGVSQGLVIKKVQPIYPQIAMTMHVEGIVQLQATISKTGDITSLKVISGDARLVKAATDAVKQWKYKPYLLDGEPVEIQTTITLNFKAPN